MHRALAYVLLNQRKHEQERHPAAPPSRTVDAFSSGPWFDGWHVHPAGMERCRSGDPPVVAPRAWLLREGWKRAGRIVPA